MTSTTFSSGTTIQSGWLNDVNTATYNASSGITGATTRTQVSKNSDVVSVKDFGAIGNGATDDTAAIAAAIAAVSEGGTVFFPASTGHYVFTQLTITKTVSLVGAGWHCGLQANFADASWSSTSYVSGSILRSTYTGSGSAITCTTIGKSPRFKNLALIGPGSGTSTAITFGSLASYQVLGKWDDFFIANFYNGPVWSNVEDWECSSVRIRAMATNGFTLQSGGATVNVTNDVFYNLEIQRCTTGILITEASEIEFHGGLIQNCTTAIKLVPSASGRVAGIAWHKTWFEANTTNVALDMTSGGIQWLEFSSTIHNGSGNFFTLTNPSNNTVTRLRLDDVAAAGWALDLSPGASIGPAYARVSGTGCQFSSITPSNATTDVDVLNSSGANGTLSLLNFLPNGYVTDGSVDYTTQVQAFFTYCATYHVRGVLPAMDILISSTISIDAGVGRLSNFEIVSQSSQGAWAFNVSGAGPRWLWNAVGGTMFYMNNVRDATFQLGVLLAKSGKTIGVGIDIDGANSTNIKLKATIGPGSGTLTTGMRIANTSTSGNDLHVFDDFYVTGATDGVLIGNGQSKFNRFYNSTFSNCTNGIRTIDGSFVLFSPNFSANAVDVYLGAPTDNINIYAPQSELSGRFLYTSGGGSSGAQGVNVFGGRLRTDAGHLNGDTKYIYHTYGGPVNLWGVDFASGVYVSTWRAWLNDSSTPNAVSAINAIGCVFPNSTIWFDKTAQNITMFGCRIINSDSSQSPAPSLFSTATSDAKNGLVLGGMVVTLAANATTIDASLASSFITQANAGATAIASISNGRPGQTIRIYGGSSTNATTIPDSGAFKLNTAAGTMTLSNTNSIVLTTPDGTNWYEDSRSVNV